jgi:hypothetical protein
MIVPSREMLSPWIAWDGERLAAQGVGSRVGHQDLAGDAVNASESVVALAESRILAATGQGSLAEALVWIAQGYVLKGDEHQVLADLAVIAPSRPDTRPAAFSLTRKLSHSDIDSAAVLFRLDAVAPAAAYRDALAHLASKTKDHTLASVDASAVLASQREDRFTFEALAAVAGLSYSDLEERVDGLPGDARSAWTPTQVNAAFAVIDEIIRGNGTADLPGAVPMRPLDLIPTIAGDAVAGGWQQVEAQRTGGVPYEVLLAQRAAGGAWLAHRNTTSSLLSHNLAQRLVDALDARKVSYLRASGVGGDVSPSVMQARARSAGQIGLLALDGRGDAAYGVAFSSARDSGTASKNASRLMTMQRDHDLPTAVLVSGRGWSARNETGDLALAFDGRLYSDQSIDALADDILRVVQLHAATHDGATK